MTRVKMAHDGDKILQTFDIFQLFSYWNGIIMLMHICTAHYGIKRVVWSVWNARQIRCICRCGVHLKLGAGFICSCDGIQRLCVATLSNCFDGIVDYYFHFRKIILLIPWLLLQNTHDFDKQCLILIHMCFLFLKSNDPNNYVSALIVICGAILNVTHWIYLTFFLDKLFDDCKWHYCQK